MLSILQFSSSFFVVDNSGVSSSKCLKCYGPKNKFFCRIGDVCLLVIKKSIPFVNKKELYKKKKKYLINSGQLWKGLVVCSKDNHFLLGSHFGIGFYDSIVLLKKNGDLYGSRIFGFVSFKLRYSNFIRVLSLASYLIF